MKLVVLNGEPKSTQHIYGMARYGRFPRRYMTDEGRALKEKYQWEARAQWKGKPLTGEVRVHITLCFGTKCRADWDNFHKLSMDALSGIAYEDDSQIKQATVALAYDKQRPRIEIAVSPLQSTGRAP
jgi:Holliday junction resolvase RusA-like endonuclease